MQRATRRFARVDGLLLFFGEDGGAALMVFGGRHAIGLVEVGESAEALLFALEFGFAALAWFDLDECFISARMNAVEIRVGTDRSGGDAVGGCAGGSGLGGGLFFGGGLRLRALRQHLAGAAFEIL